MTSPSLIELAVLRVAADLRACEDCLLRLQGDLESLLPQGERPHAARPSDAHAGLHSMPLGAPSLYQYTARA